MSAGSGIPNTVRIGVGRDLSLDENWDGTIDGVTSAIQTQLDAKSVVPLSTLFRNDKGEI